MPSAVSVDPTQSEAVLAITRQGRLYRRSAGEFAAGYQADRYGGRWLDPFSGKQPRRHRAKPERRRSV